MPKKVTVTAKVPANEKKGIKEMIASVDVNFVDVEGDANKALQEAIQMFGAKAILTNAFANWRVTLQGNIRGGLLRGESAKDLQTRLGDAKMGTATAGAKVDAEQAFMAKLMAMTPEDRAKKIEELKAKARQ